MARTKKRADKEGDNNIANDSTKQERARKRARQEPADARDAEEAEDIAVRAEHAVFHSSLKQRANRQIKGSCLRQSSSEIHITCSSIVQFVRLSH